jgi:BirA family biotin operon repressor/biotin-[acetyl-CoA-carboxylase] ligase
MREEGLRIDASPRKGYLVHHVPDLLLPEEIRQGLNTKIFGQKRIEALREIDSTNRLAKDLAHQGAPEGTIVIAECQSQGRGRMGRKWFSPDGHGIYCSFILRPRLSPADVSGITLMTAVAVADLLRSETDLPAQIKWPNDILVGGKKISGILTEASMEMDLVDFAIIGWGLNVNIPLQAFPEDLRGMATSLLIETGRTFHRRPLLQGFLKRFEDLYSIFLAQGLLPILERWKEFTDILGRPITLEVLGKSITGEVSDIDPSGALLLRDPAGKTHRIHSGDITLLDSQTSLSLSEE